ncbi:hypothetical protein PT277_10020 [Acetobacteraceae bacterium ESL0709]|nr:hypothetical protein [Acetobacteraceae bacterium ESL0697]MDF7679017.1 hypothetical protein [Acetobacteraceae bacterium ESL0709]
MKSLSQFTKMVCDKAQKWANGSPERETQPTETGNVAFITKSPNVFPERELLQSFQEASHIIEQENMLLRNDAPMEAMGLLARKTSAIERLHDLIESIHYLGIKPDELSSTLQEAQTKFSSVIEQNDELLQKSIHTQSVVMQILVDAASESTQQSYNYNGDMVTDRSQASLSVNNKI